MLGIRRRSSVPVLAALAGVAGVLLSPGAALATNDPFWNQQYGPRQIRADVAWSRSQGAGVKIAIVDSGVDIDHPDLKPRLVAGCPGPECRDLANDDANPDDDAPGTDGEGKPVKGHGTLVAGIAAAATDNGTGVAGVAPQASIMPLKVFGESQSLTGALTDIATAVDFAVDHGAKVVNLSLAEFELAGLVGTLESACNDAFARGSLCVIASGNGGTTGSGYSQGLRAVLVTANDAQGRHAAFGQKADTQWGLSAPGVDVVSTYPADAGSYAKASGTSMSAPHVAGVAALLFAQGLSNAAVVDRLRATAASMGDPGTNGWGLVDAGAAVGASAGGGGGGSTPTTAAAGGKGSGGGAGSPGGGGQTTLPPPTAVPDTSTPEVTTLAGPGGEADAEAAGPDFGGGREGGGGEADAATTAVAAALLLAAAAATALQWRAAG